MKVTKILAIAFVLISMVGCGNGSGSKKEEEKATTCTYKTEETKLKSKQSVVFYEKDGKVSKFEVVASAESGEENSKDLDKQFEEIYGKIKDVKISSEQKDGMYTVTIGFDLSKLKDEELDDRYAIIGIQKDDKFDKIIKNIEETGYECK